jgi:hypothetical protein
LLSNSEQLSQLLIGRSSQLFLTQEPDNRNPGEFFTNVAGIAPLPPGVVPPQAPAGFVRSKDKAKTQTGPQGQPVQTYVAPQAVPTNTVSLSAPTNTTVESF